MGMLAHGVRAYFMLQSVHCTGAEADTDLPEAKPHHPFVAMLAAWQLIGWRHSSFPEQAEFSKQNHRALAYM